jgi:hypothetical protein
VYRPRRRHAQRTRFNPYGSDQSIVTIYAQQKQYLVQDNVCQYYCPLDVLPAARCACTPPAAHAAPAG